MRTHLLAGQWVEGKNAEEVVAPFTGDVLDVVPRAEPAEVEQAIATASRCASQLASTPVYKRIEILRGISRRLVESQSRLAMLISQEAAKPIDLATGEVLRAAQTFSVAADELSTRRDEVIPLDMTAKTEHKWGLSSRFPVGPVSAITPFNFPLNLVAHKLAPAIAANCPIVIKPANKTPLSALALSELVLEAGWMPEALSTLNIAIDDSKPLITDDRMALLTFTGSDHVGWMLKGMARKKRVLLELGGDAAVVVAEDAEHLKRIATRVAFGAFAFSGQVCISVQRVLVHRSRYDEFRAALVEATQKTIRTGAPSESGVLVSALIDRGAHQKVSGLIQQARAAGATVEYGGDDDGRIIEPTILSALPPHSNLRRVEAFGPVVYLEPFDSDEQAINRVNASRFGLQAGLYTARQQRIDRYFRQLQVGALIVNDIPTFRVDHMPYGGVKDSGLGREGLRYAFNDYTEQRMLVLPTFGAQ